MNELPQFRRHLRKDGFVHISDRMIEKLISSAEHLVRLYFLKYPQPRPSEVEREFRAMAKSLHRASDAANKAGPDWLRLMLL